MRQIVLDTETTGLRTEDGNRIIEIGCVELLNRRLTGNNLHFYINPDRDSEPGALEVHGITTEFLADKPRFADVADRILAYVSGAEVLIHNAAFDLGFLDAELRRLDRGRFTDHVSGVVDTLLMARELFPGKRNSLDALCERLGVSNAHRTLHGALLDAEILSEVYLALTRGQETFDIGLDAGSASALADLAPFDASALLRVVADPSELQAHEAMLDGLDKEVRGRCVWRTEPVA